MERVDSRAFGSQPFPERQLQHVRRRFASRSDRTSTPENPAWPLCSPVPTEPSWRRLLDDQVEGDERDLLEAHLDDCEPCRERLALLAGLPPDQVVMAASLGGTPAQTLLDQIGLGEPVTADSKTGAAKPPELPGFDDFHQIGRGGMGAVYRAHDVERDRPVAVKVLSNAARLDASALSRALREARALERLNHPNIVRVFETGEIEGLPYIVMEWVEGGDLGDRLAKVPLPPDEAAALARTLALAVAAAHQSGIIHRDIKPRNVLLTPDGSPRLTDFGLALDLKTGERITSSGFSLGTPGYMAPEQVDATLGPVGPLADVHALGATLYAMLTGRPPFQAAGEGELYRQIVDREAVPPHRLNDAIPRDLDTICCKCLEKKPARRYDSADALATDLGSFLEGRPIRARAIGPLGLLLRQARHRPAQTALGVLVVVLLLALAFGSLYFGRNQALLREAAENSHRLTSEREAEARASAEHARLLSQALGEGMDATSRAIMTMKRSSQPEVQQLLNLHLTRVSEVYEGYFQNRSPEAPWAVSELTMLDLLAEFCQLQGRAEDSVRYRRQCLDVGIPLLEKDPRNIKLRCLLVGAASTLAFAKSEAGGPAAAIADFERAYHIGRGIAPGDITESYDHYVRSMSASNLATTYLLLQRYEEAGAVDLDALTFTWEVRARRPDDAVLTAMMIDHLTGLATARIDQGESEEVTPLLDEADALLASLVNAGPTDPARDVPGLRDQIGEVRNRLRKGPEHEAPE